MKRFLFVIVAVAGCLVAAPAVEAGFLFVKISDGTTELLVQDGGAGDLTPGTVDAIVVDPSLLLATFSKLDQLGGSTVTSTSNQSTAGGDGYSTISTQFTLKGNGAEASSFTVTSWQADFVVPGDPKFVASSGSFVFTLSEALSATFQGSVGTTNGASDEFDDLIAANSTNNAVSFGGGNGSGFNFSNGNSGYSIQNVLTASLIAKSGVIVQNSGTTTVAVPVPEPSAIVLLATFVAPVAFGLKAYRRRLAK